MKSKKTLKKTLIICTIFITASCLLLFTGCEPNVNNEAAGTTSIMTTPRTSPATTTTSQTTAPENQETNEGTAVGEMTPTAFQFTAMSIKPALLAQVQTYANGSPKIGWGLGKETDGKNRPVDALAAQKKYGELGAIFIDDKTENRIYLTFDEGYENGFTPKILDALKATGVKATFFVTYDYCKDQPELIRRMINEGHEVGNHSYSHPSFPDVPTDRVKEEIQKLHDYVKENFNYEMRLVRFPKGEFSSETLSIAKELGYRSVFWSFAYADWQTDNQPPQEESFGKITAASHPGAVILLHAVSETNAEILPRLIEFWINNGLKPTLFE
ncbi:MAG: polysaccharide deacetylase family protein [Oscillospiraceae bacterium]|nr:polysaccharide deacetylase family protein [Oscillospiraceae bacterium]